MNADPVLIDDYDDVDMDPVVIIDEDDEKINNEKTVSVPAVVTIDSDDETPVPNGRLADKNIITKVAPEQINFKKSEASFVNNLRNNRLMDKIVTRCINMENAIGMPRVIYKTLLPLYRDTENTFKESDLLRNLLKKTYKLLIRDPDHKFLHVKTLCEELKSGGLRRKVPFVTLATNLKNKDSEWNYEELTSSSREMYQMEARNQHNKDKRNNNTRNRVPRKVRGKKVVKKKAPQLKTCIKTRRITQKETKEKADIINLDDSENESEEVYGSKKNDESYIVIVEDSNKENHAKDGTLSDENLDYELLIPKNHVNVLPIECDVSHNPNEEIIASVSHNQNEEVLVARDNNALIASNNEKVIANLEKQIADYKKTIDQLEVAEVVFGASVYESPYYLCSLYKKKVVELYKMICERKGNCKDLVKRREIRLHVTEGHPPGPAKTLERFLNGTIDRTGAVEFPDFSDVVKCVVESNLRDNLGWCRQQVVEEAVALFRQCGQALRKRRQKREYMDLLSLVRDKEDTDDPAEKDPILQAKLEENKLIARIKEEEILERYVNMEKYALPSGLRNLPAGDNLAFETDKDSSDSESEQNITLPNNKTTPTISVQPEMGECSRNNINLGLLLTHNIILTTAPGYNQCVMKESSNRNDVIINNNIDVTSTAPSSTFTPILMNLLTAPQNFVGMTVNNNQFVIGESSQMNKDISHNHLNGLPTNISSETSGTTNTECTENCRNTEENSTVKNSELSSIDNNMKIDENTEIPENNEQNNNDIENTGSFTTNEGVEQNCDSSTSPEVKVKSEDNERREPLDIQSMLDELGSGFVCQVFDIEDPFLVIEISSDGSIDDEL